MFYLNLDPNWSKLTEFLIEKAAPSVIRCSDPLLVRYIILNVIIKQKNN